MLGAMTFNLSCVPVQLEKKKWRGYFWCVGDGFESLLHAVKRLFLLDCRLVAFCGEELDKTWVFYNGSF